MGGFAKKPMIQITWQHCLGLAINSQPPIVAVDKIVLQRVYSMIEDSMLYDEAWYETAEELISTPSRGRM